MRTRSSATAATTSSAAAGPNDYLQGDGGNDSLFGENNRDDLHGSEGDDTLTGGEGRDDFWGDAGFDVCNFLGRSEKLNSCERREEDRRRQGRSPWPARGRRASPGASPDRPRSSPPTATRSRTSTRKIAGFKTVRELRRQGRDEASRQGFRTPGQAQRGRAGHGRPTARVRRGDHLQAQSPADRVGLHQHLLARLLVPGRDGARPATTRTTPVKFNITMPPKRGPKCDVAIWGKIGHSKSKKGLTAKLLYR